MLSTTEVLVPGSDFLVAGVARLILAVGIIALVVIGIVRLIRALRHSPVRHSPVRHPWRTAPLLASAAVTLVGLVATVITWPPHFETPVMPELPQLLPDEAFFYRPVTDLAVSSDSDRWIGALESMPLSAAFGSHNFMGSVSGVPFNLADSSTPMINVEITHYNSNSYPGPYPITDPPLIEGLPNYGNDQHYLAVDLDKRRAWELISIVRWFGRWQASAGASWTMDSLDYPTGSTIAARLPLLPGVITYDQVASGSVDHVILGSSKISAPGKFLWPARGADGTSTNSDAPPMGAWLRLRADADLSGLGPQARVIASAAQRYGIIISDTGIGLRMRGTADRRWDQSDLRTLGTLNANDFEFVDSSGVMVSKDSLAAHQPAAGSTSASGG